MMSIKDWFTKEKKPTLDPLKELTLANMKVGYFVDFDQKTWEVMAVNWYDFGQGDRSYEWQLQGADSTVYLELEQDDEEYWTLSWKIPFARLGAKVKEHLLEEEDPPDQIEFEGIVYYLEETAGGHYFKGGLPPGKEFLRWSYEDNSGEKYLEIEQWGEEDFEATAGRPVEEYHFTNILPREIK